jgi:hypothetical protein
MAQANIVLDERPIRQASQPSGAKATQQAAHPTQRCAERGSR